MIIDQDMIHLLKAYVRFKTSFGVISAHLQLPYNYPFPVHQDNWSSPLAGQIYRKVIMSVGERLPAIHARVRKCSACMSVPVCSRDAEAVAFRAASASASAYLVCSVCF